MAGLASSVATRFARAMLWRQVPEDIRDELDLLRYDRMRAQVPMLYAALLCLVATAAFAVSPHVPKYIQLGIPLAVMVLCVARLSVWLRRTQLTVDADTARTMIATLTWLSIATCALCSLWGVVSWSQALPADKAYFPLFMAMGSLSVAYCLSTVPIAAMGNMAFGLLPITITMLWARDQMSLAAATSIIAASLFLLRMILQQNSQLIDLLVLQRMMRSQATTDSLTGIANRRALYEALDAEIERSNSTRHCAVALIDLDGFKPVNDDHGHATGDILLRQVAERMIETCGHDAMVARLGGDEFALLVPVGSQLTVQRHVDAILASLARPFAVGPRQIHIGASVGIAQWPDGGGTSDELIASADRALYRAKALRQLTRQVPSPVAAALSGASALPGYVGANTRKAG